MGGNTLRYQKPERVDQKIYVRRGSSARGTSAELACYTAPGWPPPRPSSRASRARRRATSARSSSASAVEGATPLSLMPPPAAAPASQPSGDTRASLLCALPPALAVPARASSAALPCCEAPAGRPRRCECETTAYAGTVAHPSQTSFMQPLIRADHQGNSLRCGGAAAAAAAADDVQLSPWEDPGRRSWARAGWGAAERHAGVRCRWLRAPEAPHVGIVVLEEAGVRPKLHAVGRVRQRGGGRTAAARWPSCRRPLVDH